MFESGQTPSKLTLAYVLLAHESAGQIAELVRTLLDGDRSAHVVVHYDRNAPDVEFEKLEQLLGESGRAWLVRDRVKCGWGRFGLVDGVVRALRTLREHQVDCDYVYLLSGSCMPTKPLALLKRFLAENQGMEFIEAHPAEWMVDGLREERYQYRHWFSYRTHRNLFEGSWRLQRTLGLRRRLPRRLVAKFGPQWWCLTRTTCFAILDFIDQHPGAYRFFKTTWIPDELFFQTMAASIATPARVFDKSLTFFRFTPRKGRPINFYDDHIELVPELPCFFARKISPTAHRLRRRLAEIAAEPDDGREFPTLDTRSEIFNYEKRVLEQVQNPPPGQLFFGGQSFSRWPSSLAQVHRPFVVLHGPPSVTRIVRDHLRQSPGLTLLGRVFRPKSIDFEPLGEAYEGFTADDAKIRDQDPPLYLSRLLERADGLPVIEVSPGDVPLGEGHFLFNSNAVFVSCQPNNPTDEANRRLYWTLAAIANPASAADVLLGWSDRSSRQDVPRYADSLIEKYSPAEHRKWITDTLLVWHQDRPFIRLSWGAGRRTDDVDATAAQLSRLRETFGGAITALARGLTGIEDRLASVRPLEITQDLPQEWQAFFTGGAGHTLENWAAAFDHSDIGYAVLHGPPALTRPVRDRLSHMSGVSMLGRVFGPTSAELADEHALDLSPDALVLRERDRPLYLRRLLAAADGFPIIEISPGDEPVGERFFTSHRNAVFISCQPDLASDDDNRQLYWALAALANPAGERDALRATMAPGNSLKGRARIDAFVQRHTPRGHREWLDRTVLDRDWVGKRTLGNDEAGAFIPLFWGAGRGVGSLASEGPLRAERRHGPAPLLEQLDETRAQLACLGPAEAADTLPEEWREYFRSGDTADGWATALRRSSVTYAVLHGPAALTQIVREHLRDAEGVTFLGRVFSPQPREDGDGASGPAVAQSDRPRFLTDLLAKADGFPVVEICLGDEPACEAYLLRDENALFVSCQPDHSDDGDRERLYWTLGAVAGRPNATEQLHPHQRQASLLRVRNEIDAVIEAFAPHREYLSEILLGSGAPPQVLRLPTGTGERVSAAEPLTHALARLRRGLGPAFRPLLRGLNDVDAKLGVVTIADLTADFPPDWRDYFSTGAAPTFDQWELAMSPVNALYAVLYGPPAATASIRTHLAGLPGVRMLGRLFDPDAAAKAAASPQAARDARKRREDRPLVLAQALSEGDGFAVIEVCPGDERHGEEFFLTDANALILSCEPMDPGDSDQMALYWALVASGNRAASRELAGDAANADHGPGPRQRLEAFVDRKVLSSHREWFGEAVLAPEDDPRIVRLPWTGDGADDRRELLQARLARLGNDLGPDVAPLADGLTGIEKSLAEQSLAALVAGLPFEWRQLFVEDVEAAEEKVA